MVVCGPEHPREKGWSPTGGAEDAQIMVRATQYTTGLSREDYILVIALEKETLWFDYQIL